MKIVMVAVTSLNGKLTRGLSQDIYEWTSPEDQKLFFDLLSKNKLIVMGSSTFEVIRGKFKTKKGQLRIILTSSQEKYKGEQVEGALEFSSETPVELVNRLSKTYKQMLLVGGAKVYSSFLEQNLVDEIYLTVEPVIFGQGKNLFSEGEFESNLEIISSEKLNKKGTLLLKYKVIK